MMQLLCSGNAYNCASLVKAYLCVQRSALMAAVRTRPLSSNLQAFLVESACLCSLRHAMQSSWQRLGILHGAEAAAALAAAAAQMGPYTQQIWGAGDGTFLPGGCGQKTSVLHFAFKTRCTNI